MQISYAEILRKVEPLRNELDLVGKEKNLNQGKVLILLSITFPIITLSFHGCILLGNTFVVLLIRLQCFSHDKLLEQTNIYSMC